MVSVMVRVKLAGDVPEMPLTKPESKPPARGSQGFANDDWETVWFVPETSKMKVTVSLMPTVTLFGLKNRPGVPPLPSSPT